MLSKGRPLALRRTAPRAPRPHSVVRRHVSTHGKSPTPWRTESAEQPEVLVTENFARHTISTLDVFKRVVKFTAVGLLIVGTTTLTAFQAAHMWVEHVELAAEADPEVRTWEWDLEAERWTGGAAGGTDPGLEFMGRLATRSAWIAQNWGTGSGANVVRSKAGRTGPGSGGLNFVEARLELAQDFINLAVDAALKKQPSGRLRPETLNELIVRHANVMERMGSRDALFHARSDYERGWALLPVKSIDAARVALKLGDLNRRLGDSEDAMAWWARTIQLTQGEGNSSIVSIPPAVPESVPSSPLAQRTLLSTLVSLSAYYATSGQLKQAQALEESSLNLLRSIRQPESLEAATPPQTLHALYILHRSSLLSIHLAEVLYALRHKPVVSIEWLTRAAESSERVALVLTGLPTIHPDAPNSNIPHPPSTDVPLVSDYAKSRTMARAASSLLRDARRTAAEAWSLTGVLAEGSGAPGSPEKALECYERALGWAGVAGDTVGGIGKPGDGILEAEWQVLWANYIRVRDSVNSSK